jgi:hypothetical protein
MKPRLIAAGAMILLGNVLLLTPCSASEPRTPTCKQFVHYDKSSFSITLPNFHSVKLGSLDKKPEKIQDAAALTQLFDIVQFSNCQTLDRLWQQPDAEEYVQASRATLDSNNKLLELAIQFNAFSKDEKQAGKLAETAASSLIVAKTLQTSSTQTGVKAIDLEKIAKDLHGELSVELSRLMKIELPREKFWSLISDDRRKSIRAQLKRGLDLLRSDGYLHLGENDLAAFVLMPGGDGQLYFPPGLFVKPGPDADVPPPFSIPKGYGASGLAFDENKEEFADINDTMLKMGDSDDAIASQKKVRMIILPENAMRHVTARYVAAFPIDNTAGQPVAVMSISVYKILQRSDDLRDACQRLHFATITNEISNLLTLSP